MSTHTGQWMPRILALLWLAALPLAADVDAPKFSVEHGFFYTPFMLEIAVPHGTVVFYTFNGTEPTMTGGILYTEALQITTTVCVRAAAFTGTDRSRVVTRTYIFPTQVQLQDGAGWPTNWGRVRGAPGANYYVLYGRPFPLKVGGMLPADYQVDPDVARHPRYMYLFTNDLVSVPTLSLVCDPADLFSSNGIYFDANTLEHGDQWERPASIEFINPGRELDFQEDCTIQIQGGASRNTWFCPKHNLRLTFKAAVGVPVLEAPLFADTPVNDFNSLILRACFNFSWNGTLFGCEPHAQYLRDAFIRDLQCDMGSVCGRTRHVQLYIDGLYWGLYLMTERPDNAFGESYFGGDKEEYDVIDKYGTQSGTRDAFNQMFSIAHAGTATSAQYAQVQQYLDVEHFIDYMLINHWGANYDWPDGNWRCLRRRVPGAGFKYCSWDAEWTVTYFEPYWWNRASSGDLRHEISKIRDTPNDLNTPGTLFWLLYDNPEFRLRYADHVHRQCFNDGVLAVDYDQPAWDPAHPERNAPAARYAAMAAGIERAVICESARWGDTWRPVPYQQHAEWKTERDYILTTWLTHRTTNFVQICRAEGLYPTLDAPEFSLHGGRVTAGFELIVSNRAGMGNVFVTTDGSDPRVPYKGTPADQAITPGDTPLVISHCTHVKARAKLGSQWSALTEATFYVTNDYADICISEIMYNPSDGQAGEFIELHNAGTAAVALAGMRFTEGIHAELPRGLTLPAGGYAVFSTDDVAFKQRYPHAPATYHYIGRLDNGGELLQLCDPFGTVVDAVAYDDEWYRLTDGGGYSLTRLSCTGNADEKSAWRASRVAGGTPGFGDANASAGPLVISEILPYGLAPLEAAIELLNTSTQLLDISGWYLSNDGADLQQCAVPPGTTVAPTGYVVLYQGDFPAATPPFPLSPFGGALHVSSPETPPLALASAYYGPVATDGSVARYSNSVGDVMYLPPARLTLGTNVFAGDPPGRSNEFRAGHGAPNAPPRVGPVVINEIMYHPLEDEHEFIELFNTGGTNVSLFDGAGTGAGWRVSDDTGVAFTFPSNTTIRADGYVVVVGEGTDCDTFRHGYDIPPDVPVLGPCSRNFGNHSDAVILSRPVASPTGGPPVYVRVETVGYYDDAPWPCAADGKGPSLERIDPAAIGNEPDNWYAQTVGGTPGGVPEPGVAAVILLLIAGRLVRYSHITQEMR